MLLRAFFGAGIASSTFARRGWKSTRELKLIVSLDKSFLRGVFTGVGRTGLEAMCDSSISVSEEAGDGTRTLCLRGVGIDRLAELDCRCEVLCDGEIGEEGGENV